MKYSRYQGRPLLESHDDNSFLAIGQPYHRVVASPGMQMLEMPEEALHGPWKPDEVLEGYPRTGNLRTDGFNGDASPFYTVCRETGFGEGGARDNDSSVLQGRLDRFL